MLFPRYPPVARRPLVLAATAPTVPGSLPLIQHSAGSGKSNTIAWLAHRTLAAPWR